MKLSEAIDRLSAVADLAQMFTAELRNFRAAYSDDALEALLEANRALEALIDAAGDLEHEVDRRA